MNHKHNEQDLLIRRIAELQNEVDQLKTKLIDAYEVMLFGHPDGGGENGIDTASGLREDRN